MTITAIFHLSASIPLKANCLNKSYSININDFKCELLTAALPDKFLKDKDNFTDPLVQNSRGIVFNSNADWGRPFIWPDGESWVNNFKVVISLDNNLILEELKDNLVLAAENWIGRFEDNMFAIGFNIHFPQFKMENINSYGVDFYYKDDLGGKTNLLHTSKQESVIIHSINSIDIHDFEYVLNATSSNGKLCLEYSLLQDSQIALIHDEFRKSVLDSATSFEVALNNYLKLNLDIPNINLLDNLLKTNNSIAKKRDLLGYCNLVLPNHNYQKGLEELRNRAIHSGRDITKDEATKAYKMVSEAIKLLVTTPIDVISESN